jgi:hypothetical protein
MPVQPDFEVTAFIPTDLDQREGIIPEWSDLVVQQKGDHDNVTWRWPLTRAAGEAMLDVLHGALHPYAGGSIRKLLWDDLDILTDLIMSGEDESDMTKGKAAGVARAIAYMLNPYDVDAALDAVREEAVERWEESR